MPPLPRRAARPQRCPAPSCAPALVPLVPRLCWGSGAQAGLAGTGRTWQGPACPHGQELSPPRCRWAGTGRGGGGWGTGWARPRTGCGTPAFLCLHRPQILCQLPGGGCTSPSAAKWSLAGVGSASSPGTPRPWHLTASSLRGQGRGGWPGVPPSHAPRVPELCRVHVPASPLPTSPGPLPVPVLPAAAPGEGLL